MCEMLSFPTVLDGVRRNHKGKQCDGGGEGDSVRVSSFLCSETFSVMEWEGGKRENRSVGHTTNPGMQILQVNLTKRRIWVIIPLSSLVTILMHVKIMDNLLGQKEERN